MSNESIDRAIRAAGLRRSRVEGAPPADPPPPVAKPGPLLGSGPLPVQPVVVDWHALADGLLRDVVAGRRRGERWP
ncbi:MAG: hypothetical protein IPM45_15600 [Acidimicrobiales bacterium]|nr:hypothetical protein [Acidimicrobiales bacterium]